MSEAPECVSSEPAALDLEAIRARHFAPVKGRRGANMWQAHDDLTALIAEVERLRPQISVFGLSRWQQKVLIEEVDLRTAEVEQLRSYASDCEQHAKFAAGKGAAMERQAVVAWLRSWDGLSDWPRTLAASIERGEHRREENE